MTTAPLTMTAPSGYGPGSAGDRLTEEYLVGELREDLEVMGVQGIIDEGGRS